MSEKESSRRAVPTKDNATATRTETERQGVQSHDSNYNCFGHGYTPEQIARGKRMLRRAEEWRALNPELFILEFELKAQYEIANDRRFSVQECIERVRMKDHVNRNGEPVKINNGFAPIFARWIVTENPQTAKGIERRSSVYDVLVGGHDGR